MKDLFTKYYRESVFAVVVLICCILIGSVLMLFSGYTTILNEQVSTKVSLYSSDVTKLLSDKTADLKAQADSIAKAVTRYTSEADISSYLQGISNSDGYSDVAIVRFFKDGIEYSATGFSYNKESSEVKKLVGSKTVVSSGMIYDIDTNMYTVAFYAPVTNSQFVDAITVFYPINVIKGFKNNTNDQMLSHAEFLAFCARDGQIIDVLTTSDTAAIGAHENVLEVMRKLTNNKMAVDDLEHLIDTGESGVFSIKINSKSYAISMGNTGEKTMGLCIIGLYPAEDAYSDGYQFINTILATLIILIIILILFSAYFVISRRATNKRIKAIGTVNIKLNCPTMLKFDRDASEILAQNKTTNFAVIAVDVKHFKYISENFGDAASDEVLKYLKILYSKALQLEELYAYDANGQFVLLMHYRDRQLLIKRLNSIYTLAARYHNMNFDKSSLKLLFGVCEVDRSENMSVMKLVDMAVSAKNSQVMPGDPGMVKFYDRKLHDNYIQVADIEVKMESALKNEEFKIFFQPKYNIKHDCTDGCEVLVRWYNKEKNEYYLPGKFLPQFEANGFIVELDKYVYKKTCEYIKKSVDNGWPLYPVSVNVSRITAIQNGFVKYYTDLKNKYNIPDKFIMIEFTESFAYENYEVLYSVIDAIHKNGFLASIDDFGSGYSSYNVLKVLPMDEIKLDRFFIEKGISEERDNALLQSVISVAKEMKMKVTQEGIETKEDLERLSALGCDVIQGFYYSKALALDDYITFLEQNNKK